MFSLMDMDVICIQHLVVISISAALHYSFMNPLTATLGGSAYLEGVNTEPRYSGITATQNRILLQFGMLHFHKWLVFKDLYTLTGKTTKFVGNFNILVKVEKLFQLFLLHVSCTSTFTQLGSNYFAQRWERERNLKHSFSFSDEWRVGKIWAGWWWWSRWFTVIIWLVHSRHSLARWGVHFLLDHAKRLWFCSGLCVLRY